MANLEDTAVDWEAGVYQIETTDPVLGGAPNVGTGAGMSNIPHLQLAKRTIWLKDQITQIIEDFEAVGSFRTAQTVSASFELEPSDAGKAFICASGSAITITLPSFDDTAVGSAFTLINTGAANVTVLRAASDTIDNGPSSVTSMVIPPNMSLTLIKGGTSWHPISLTSQSLAFSFGSSLGATGWQRLPSGLIIQWGGYSIGTGAGASQSVSFPIVFPTAIRTTWIGTENGATEMIGTTSRTVSGMTVIKGASDSGFARTGFWFAMGH